MTMDSSFSVTPATDPLISRTIAKRAISDQNDYAPFANFDWEKALRRFDPDFAYPEYYLKGYHGVEQTKSGYLSAQGAVSWDPVIRETFAYLQVPGFTQQAVTRQIIEDTQLNLGLRPARILDLGTGTGHAAFAFAEHYRRAEVWGVDLSPHMLAVADFKAERQGQSTRVKFRQASAHQTGFANGQFDLVLAWALFHEVPAAFTRQILAEMHRVLAPGGKFIIFDAFERKTVRIIPFPEPYLREFQQLDFVTELSAAGFKQVSRPLLTEGNWYAQGCK